MRSRVQLPTQQVSQRILKVGKQFVLPEHKCKGSHLLQQTAQCHQAVCLHAYRQSRMTRVTEVAQLSIINSDPNLSCLFHQSNANVFKLEWSEK